MISCSFPPSLNRIVGHVLRFFAFMRDCEQHFAATLKTQEIHMAVFVFSMCPQPLPLLLATACDLWRATSQLAGTPLVAPAATATRLRVESVSSSDVLFPLIRLFFCFHFISRAKGKVSTLRPPHRPLDSASSHDHECHAGGQIIVSTSLKDDVTCRIHPLRSSTSPFHFISCVHAVSRCATFFVAVIAERSRYRCRAPATSAERLTLACSPDGCWEL